MSDTILSRYKITDTGIMIMIMIPRTSCRKRYPFSCRPGVRSICNAWITTDLSRQREGVMCIWMAVFSATGNSAFVSFSWWCSVYVVIKLLLADLTMQSIVKMTSIIVKLSVRRELQSVQKKNACAPIEGASVRIQHDAALLTIHLRRVGSIANYMKRVLI